MGGWFVQGWAEFSAGRWFEAHEVWEAGWRELARGDEKKLWVQGLIQLAVSLEHWRRRNPRGAWGQWEKGRAKLSGVGEFEARNIGLLLQRMALFYEQVGLLEAVQAQAEGREFFWAPVPEGVHCDPVVSKKESL